MRRFSGCVTLIVLVLLMFSGCNKEVTGDQKTAKDYVEAMGYKINSYNDYVYKFTVENESMEGTLNQQIWSVQKLESDKYFGKVISMYSFTVSNHPLRKLYNLKTTVSIMLCEGKVIGGTSFPVGEGGKKID